MFRHLDLILACVFVVALAPAAVPAATIDVAAFLVDPAQYQNFSALNFTQGGGVAEMSMIRGVKFWDTIVNQTEIFPGVRFRVIYVWLPYPQPLWNAFITNWANRTAEAARVNGTAGVPKFWIFPQVTFYIPDVAVVMEKYDAIGLSFSSFSIRPFETNFPTNRTRRFAKLFSLSFTVESATEILVRTIFAHGGRKVAHLINTDNIYEESVDIRLKELVAQLNGTFSSFIANSTTDTANIPSIVRNFTILDPDLVIFRQSYSASLLFLDECSKYFYYPRSLRMTPDNAPASWPSSIDRRFWVYESNSPITARLQAPFNDYYFPIVGNRGSMSFFQGNWSQVFPGIDPFVFSGWLVPSGMSVLHQAILATRTYNDTTVIANYMQNNTFTSFHGRISFGSLGDFQATDRIIVQNIQPDNKVVFPFNYANGNLTFPIPLGCPPPPPSPSAICGIGSLTWIQNRSLIIGGGGGSAPSAPGAPASAAPPVVISSPIAVNGNVSIITTTLILGAGNTSLSGRSTGPAVVSATGCIDIQGGQLQLPFSLTNQTVQGTRVVLISTSDCLTGRFDTIVPIFEPVACTRVTANPTYTPRDLSIAFSITNDGCPSEPALGGNAVSDPLPSWVLPVAVSAAVLVALVIVTVICMIPSEEEGCTWAPVQQAGEGPGSGVAVSARPERPTVRKF